MDPQTAAGAYGYSNWTPAFPGGMAIMPETQVGVSGDVPGAVLPKIGLSMDNPLLWVLILAMILTGYLYGGFDVGIKGVGNLKLKV